MFPSFQADVIVLHYASSWRRLAALLLLRLLNPRARLLLHEHHYTAAVDRQVPHRKRFHSMLRLTYRLVDTVVAVSRAQGEWMRSRRLVPRSRLRVIPPCRDLGKFLKVPPPVPGKPLVLGAYGRLHRQKGFDFLLQAMRLLPSNNFRLLVGGTGPEKAALEKLAENLPQVEFVGDVSNVPAFLEYCDVIVVPSRYEPYGLVCLEAKAAGRPVVVADVDGLPEQVNDCGLIVPPGDVEALTGALRSLCEQPLHLWGRNGRALTLALWDNYQTTWEELLNPVNP
jgi:glycosyltransferase involved in cell wall biosynthesis